jgi:hypothetical protein
MFTSKKLHHIMVVIAVLALALGTFMNAQAAPQPQSRTSASDAQGVQLKFSPKADTYVREARPNSNYGKNKKLWVEAEPNAAYETNLTFIVSGAPGPVQSAVLRLYAVAGTVDGPAIYSTKSNWTESGITWNTRPPRTSAGLDDKGAIASNTWVEYNVTPLVPGDGTYSFVLGSTSIDSVSFSSREGSRPPQLVLSFESASADTTPDITSTPASLPTGTPLPPTATSLPAASPTVTATKAVPTDTSLPPTATNTPAASPTVTVTNTPKSTATPLPSVNPPTSTPGTGSQTKHYTANETSYTASDAIGFNVHDTGMSTSTINALPAGSQALVWVGIGASNCSATLSSTFTSFVLANAANPRLFGFYLTDEPLDNTCVAAVTAYTKYIHDNAPGKKSFILLTDWPGTYAAYRPAVTNVDLIGLDPYPVKDGKYDSTLISQQVNNAVAAGVPLSRIVPVFQTFGGEGWDAPTAAQLTTILAQWAALIPNPPLDYAYSWGTQSNALSAALVTRSDWRDIMAVHNK